MRAIQALWVLVLVSIPLTGCGVGYNRMIFVTKTNVGVDIDSKPPTAQISIGRMEGTFAPVYEGGQMPPLMGSFRFSQSDGAYLGSVFSVGDAAVTIATLFTDDDPPANSSTTQFDSKILLTWKPKYPWFVEQHENNAVRPVVFGTDTSFGIKVAWSGLTAHVPDTFRLGFNRKEIAWAPMYVHFTPNGTVGPSGEIQGTGYAKAPSLLTTVDAAASTAATTLKLEYLQFFATGTAATALSQRQSVRKAMIHRLDPNRDILSRGTYNSDPNADALRTRIRSWLGGRDTPNRQMLRDWLKQDFDIATSEAQWLATAPTPHLQMAIDHFAIP